MSMTHNHLTQRQLNVIITAVILLIVGVLALPHFDCVAARFEDRERYKPGVVMELVLTGEQVMVLQDRGHAVQIRNATGVTEINGRLIPWRSQFEEMYVRPFELRPLQERDEQEEPQETEADAAGADQQHDPDGRW